MNFVRVMLMAALVLGAATVAFAETLFFDDFSEETPASNGTPGNPRLLTNWNVASGYIDVADIVTNPLSIYYTYPEQGQFLDMDGSGRTAVNTITSKMLFEFQPDNLYTVSFATWGWRNIHDGDSTDLLSISIPGLFQTQLTIAQTDLLTHRSFTFSPSSSMTGRLIFEHDGNVDNIGPCVDDIGLSTTAVPEPGNLTLLIIGTPGLLGYRWSWCRAS